MSELSTDELAEMAEIHANNPAIDLEAKAKARASALAKLKKLGLTDKEIAAL